MGLDRIITKSLDTALDRRYTSNLEYNTNMNYTSAAFSLISQITRAVREDCVQIIFKELITSGLVEGEAISLIEEGGFNLINFIRTLSYENVLVTQKIFYQYLIDEMTDQYSESFMSHNKFDSNSDAYSFDKLQYKGMLGDKYIYVQDSIIPGNILINIQDKLCFNFDFDEHLGETFKMEKDIIQVSLGVNYGIAHSTKVSHVVFTGTDDEGYLAYKRQKTIKEIMSEP
jgi:hypothetical protein